MTDSIDKAKAYVIEWLEDATVFVGWTPGGLAVWGPLDRAKRMTYTQAEAFLNAWRGKGKIAAKFVGFP